jgi:hypothetical protein
MSMTARAVLAIHRVLKRVFIMRIWLLTGVTEVGAGSRGLAASVGCSSHFGDTTVRVRPALFRL